MSIIQDASCFQQEVVDACLEAQEEKDKLPGHWKENKYVWKWIKIHPHGSAPGRREREVRYREVVCGVH